MFFKYDAANGIAVPSPFNRIITPIMTTDLTDKPIDFSVHMTEWEPGAKVDNHCHDSMTEAMYCISGTGIATVDGVDYQFLPNTMINALPGMMHQIVNTGTERLRVLCIFSPAISGDGLRQRAQDAINEYQANLK